MAQISAHCEAGNGKANEDAYRIERHPRETDCILCIVADGQGGQKGGAAAAQTAANSCIESALAIEPGTLLQIGTWMQILQKADQAVLQETQSGFTTLIGFALWGEFLAGASNGDSGLTLIPESGDAIDLTQAQRKNPPVGSGSAGIVPFATALPPTYALLAMTDGVWKYTGVDAIGSVSVQQSGERIIDELRKKAELRETGELQDDFTLVVIQ